MTSQASGARHDAEATPAADDRPLFIVGCVRSGTTLTRDLLRRVPGLICPEETHFFRWSEPFRTPHSFAPYRHNQLLRKHRQIDGVSEKDFETILRQSRSKAELQRNYITAFARAKGITGPYRWFDKTPQNVYGTPIIVQQMPNARILHLVRNPLNVVASLVLGRQVKIPDVHGACNYWNESVQIMITMQAAYPDRILTMRYEDLVADVPGSMARILVHAQIDAPADLYDGSDAHDERNLWRKALDAGALSAVRVRCSALARRFGYDIEADLVGQSMAD